MYTYTLSHKYTHAHSHTLPTLHHTHQVDAMGQVLVGAGKKSHHTHMHMHTHNTHIELLLWNKLWWCREEVAWRHNCFKFPDTGEDLISCERSITSESEFVCMFSFPRDGFWIKLLVLGCALWQMINDVYHSWHLLILNGCILMYFVAGIP